VIHIATVHWRDDRWLEPQRRYLERHLESPYEIHLDNRPVGEGPDAHAEKLNALAEEIRQVASPDDRLIFLDGDAFPIAPLDGFLEATLSRYPLAAIRRDENLGDTQPHPAFCATTVGFWHELRGDWSRAPWTNDVGWEIDDPGGRLLEVLTAKGIEWHPLRRTNRVNLHPVLFGVYDDVVYHHGAGFRAAFDRVDRLRAGTIPDLPAGLAPDLPAGLAGFVWKVRAKHWYLSKKRPLVRRERRLMRENRALSERVFRRLQEDESFWLRV
jgi:hypothetical protein